MKEEKLIHALLKVEDKCHSAAVKAGWWDEDKKRETGTLLMLCVSELAEAMEGDRKGLMDDHLPNRKMLEVELADCIIRILDMSGGLGLNTVEALFEKLEYNKTREDHKRENRSMEWGKKY